MLYEGSEIITLFYAYDGKEKAHVVEFPEKFREILLLFSSQTALERATKEGDSPVGERRLTFSVFISSTTRLEKPRRKPARL